MKKRECLFQEDDGGRGAMIGEITHPAIGSRVVLWNLHLRPAILDYLIRKGYSEIWLRFRGGWYPHKLYR